MENCKCELCDQVFSKHFNLKGHCKNVHNVASQPTRKSPSLICEICNSSFRNFGELNKHLSHSHEIGLNNETIKFLDISEFEQWKKFVVDEQS